MEYINDWVRNIVVYMILNTIIMNLLGDKSYKKYVNIVSGMILLLIVITPILKLTKLEVSLDYFLKSNDYAVEAAEFKNNVGRMEEEQSELIFAEYEKKLHDQVEGILLEEGLVLTGFDVTFDTNSSSTTFGELLLMKLEAEVVKNREEKSDSRHTINKIDIARIDRTKEKEVPKNPPTPMEIHIKNRLADFYNIERVNINITIQE